MEMKVKLRPFNVPDGVYAEMPPKSRSEGFNPTPPYALKDIPAEALAGLCDEFRKSVFQKAGKEDPSCNKGESA